MSNARVLLFNLDQVRYGIDISKVSTIEQPLEIFKMPDTPLHVEGIINLRGKVNTVFSLRKLFALAPKEIDEETKFIMVFTKDEETICIIADSVSEIVQIDQEEIQLVAGAKDISNSSFLTGSVKYNDEVVYLLDLPQIYAA